MVAKAWYVSHFPPFRHPPLLLFLRPLPSRLIALSKAKTSLPRMAASRLQSIAVDCSRIAPLFSHFLLIIGEPLLPFELGQAEGSLRATVFLLWPASCPSCIPRGCRIAEGDGSFGLVEARNCSSPAVTRDTFQKTGCDGFPFGKQIVSFLKRHTSGEATGDERRAPRTDGIRGIPLWRSPP